MLLVILDDGDEFKIKLFWLGIGMPSFKVAKIILSTTTITILLKHSCEYRKLEKHPLK